MDALRQPKGIIMGRFEGQTMIVKRGTRGMGESHMDGFVDERARLVDDVLKEEGRARAAGRPAMKRRLIGITSRLTACLAVTTLAVVLMSATAATAATAKTDAGSPQCPRNYTGPTNPATGCPPSLIS